MYIVENTFLKKVKSSKPHADYDVNQMTLENIFNSFTDGYITLTNTKLQGKFYLTLEALRNTSLRMVTNMKFIDWLNYNQSYTLPVTTDKPVYENNTVKYSDSVIAGFDKTLIEPYKASNRNVPLSSMTDLLLTKNVPDKKPLIRNMLVTVNGYLHRTYNHNEGIGVVSGGKTLRISGKNLVGILSFKDCGEIKQVSLDNQMVGQASPIIPMKDEVSIKTQKDLTNKSILLSLGGRLFWGDDLIQVVNMNTGIVKINTKKINLLDIFMDSVGQIDLDYLGLFIADKNRNYNKIRKEELLSDICVKNFFLLPQSFLIIVDSEFLSVDTKAIDTTGLPTVYEMNNEPVYPLIDSRGLLPEYWKRSHEGIWQLKIDNDIKLRRIYQTALDEYLNTVNGISPTYKWYHDKPQQLIITCTQKK